jgi:hypothetical protein
MLLAFSITGCTPSYALTRLHLIVVLANGAVGVGNTTEQFSRVVDAILRKQSRKRGREASTSSGGADMEGPSLPSNAAAVAGVASRFISETFLTTLWC